jgi:hypothetical protein
VNWLAWLSVSFHHAASLSNLLLPHQTLYLPLLLPILRPLSLTPICSFRGMDPNDSGQGDCPRISVLKNRFVYLSTLAYSNWDSETATWFS